MCIVRLHDADGSLIVHSSPNFRDFDESEFGKILHPVTGLFPARAVKPCWEGQSRAEFPLSTTTIRSRDHENVLDPIVRDDQHGDSTDK